MRAVSDMEKYISPDPDGVLSGNSEEVRSGTRGRVGCGLGLLGYTGMEGGVEFFVGAMTRL